MKKLLFGVLSLVLFMTACKKDKEDSFMRVSVESISFTNTASKKSVFIESNVQWTAISSDTTWCKLQSGHGINSDSLFITALENTDQTERTTNITVTGEGLATKTIQVKQAATPARLVKELLVNNEVDLYCDYDTLNRIVECNISIAGTTDFMRYSLSYSGSDLVKSKYTVDGETYMDSTVTAYSKSGNVIAFIENRFKNSIQTKVSSGKIYLKSDGQLIDKIDYDSIYSKDTTTFKYDTKGNCIEKLAKSVSYSDTRTYTSTYTSTYSNFDNKYGVFSGTSTPKWWLINEINTVLYVNNYGKFIYTYSGGYSSETIVTYEYDKYGYPNVMNMGDEGKYTISYIQAK